MNRKVSVKFAKFMYSLFYFYGNGTPRGKWNNAYTKGESCCSWNKSYVL